MALIKFDGFKSKNSLLVVGLNTLFCGVSFHRVNCKAGFSSELLPCINEFEINEMKLK